MTNKIFITLGGLVALGLIAFSMLFLISGQRYAGAVGPMGTVISTATTSTAISVTTSTRILATTTNTVGTGYARIFASICNPSSNPVYLSFNSDKLANASSATTVIAAAAGYNACYEITDRNLYQGSVQASSTNQTATTVLVADYVN